MTSEAKTGQCPDQAFRWIVLVPLDRVAVVHRELMVKIVVSFAEGHKCGDYMVARRVLVIEWHFANPVSQRVDAESGLDNRMSECANVWMTSKLPYMVNNNQT